MIPGPPDDDPFAEPGPDDEAVDWPEEPPPAATSDLLVPVDDEGATELELPSRPPPDPAAPVDDDLDEDPFSDEVPADEVPEHRPRLPWRTEVLLVARGRTVPAVLDPTRATSTWEGAPADADDGEALLWLDTLTLRVHLRVASRDGEEVIRLGRDALAGRVLIAV